MCVKHLAVNKYLEQNKLVVFERKIKDKKIFIPIISSNTFCTNFDFSHLKCIKWKHRTHSDIYT